MKQAKLIIFIQSWLATLGSLYYGWYGDPWISYRLNDRFNPLHGFAPCEMCRFARIFMYPILILIMVSLFNKDDRVVDYVLPLSGLGIALEWYQYRFQMSQATETVKAVICNSADGVNCAATEVIYWWFVTIPFMALVSFAVIFVSALVWKHKQQYN